LRPSGWLAEVGVVVALLAAALRPGDAASAASQVWPAFVLVAGLLLVGVVVADDGLFEAAGDALGRRAPNGMSLFGGAMLLVVAVTTLLNLDTSVAFLTPVLIAASRRRGLAAAALCYGTLLCSNAGSFVLVGSNLTNLIVLGHLHPSGSGFARAMALPCLAAVTVTALVVVVAHRRELADGAPRTDPHRVPHLGLGAACVAAVTLAILVAPTPALYVAGVGAAAVAWRARRDRASLARAASALGLATLVGLFGLAVGFGTLGRAWDAPAHALAHLGLVGAAVLGALSSVAINNLPAAALLAARPPHEPYGLLVGLNVGPNLYVTGSLAWLLWRRAAASAGERPSLRRASVLGMLSVPLAMAAALGVLALTR
jgi:arsenical pump membrane protein